jgi:MFS family permease
MSAFEQLKNVEFCCLCIWFSICVIPLQYYVGTIGFQLEQKGDGTGFYTDLFSVIYASTAVVTPFAGYLADLFGLGISQALATVLTAGSLFFLASDNTLECACAWNGSIRDCTNLCVQHVLCQRWQTFWVQVFRVAVWPRTVYQLRCQFTTISAHHVGLGGSQCGC